MREVLAERLLAEVMGWTPEDVACYRPQIQAMAAYKYDEYHRFLPGMRFVESLACWLSQFDEGDRQLAFSFVISKLIFISDSEMTHLVSTVFSDHIRPILIALAADILAIEKYKVRRILQASEYRKLLRQSLFLGLSDGARLDWFRRANPEISNEQVYTSYDVSQAKADDMQTELKVSLDKILGREPANEELLFQNIFLLDDFSASGLSCLRSEEGTHKGKIPKVLGKIRDESSGLGQLVSADHFSVHVILYVSTSSAVERLKLLIPECLSELQISADFTVRSVQTLDSSIKDAITADQALMDFLERQFDAAMVDRHWRKGRCTRPFLGFDECALPLVLSHNTPNNSLPVLWMSESEKLRGLFPRVSRHRESG